MSTATDARTATPDSPSVDPYSIPPRRGGERGTGKAMRSTGRATATGQGATGGTGTRKRQGCTTSSKGPTPAPSTSTSPSSTPRSVGR